MEVSDTISVIAIIVSLIATFLSIFLPYFLSKKLQNEILKQDHISLVFDGYFLKDLPILLSKLFENDLNNELATDDNARTCDKISEILLKIKNIAILYYVVNNVDIYDEIKTLILKADECLVRIPDENINDPSSIVDEFKDITSQLYKLVYDNSIL